jgi:thiol-disulfide isomerase/thioredoxin
VLDFWATTCGGCRSELLNAEAAYKDANEEGIVVIGVHSSDAGRDRVEAFARQMKLSYPIAIELPAPDGEVAFGQLSGQLGVRTIPYSFVIDQQGKVVAHDRYVGNTLARAYELVSKSNK